MCLEAFTDLSLEDLYIFQACELQYNNYSFVSCFGKNLSKWKGKQRALKKKQAHAEVNNTITHYIKSKCQCKLGGFRVSGRPSLGSEIE